MRVLLDTHSLVWFSFADPKLATTAKSVIEDSAHEILLSPASYWEIAIKVALGKWRLSVSYEHLMDSLLTVYGFHVLPITPNHTARLVGMDFHHKDPFDRLLAAQALVEDIPMVSADSIFDRYGVSRIWT